MTSRARVGRRTTPYGLHNIMDFGKWYGWQISALIDRDPDYLAWCVDNVEGFALTDEADKALDDALLE